MPVYNALISGIGGQGVITLGTYLKKAALRAGLHVSGSERRGGAQREGHVSTIVRYQWGEDAKGPDERHGVASPLLPAGSAHLLIGLEPLEALRVARYLHEDCAVILNLFPLPPISVRLGEAQYPATETILTMMQRIAKRVYAWNLSEVAQQQFGHLHAVNGISLGIASQVGGLPVSESDLLHALKEQGRPEDLECFQLGVDLAHERR
jgi:indolepyruvate ferredoxin oxidoreductase beta subunit